MRTTSVTTTTSSTSTTLLDTARDALSSAAGSELPIPDVLRLMRADAQLHYSTEDTFWAWEFVNGAVAYFNVVGSARNYPTIVIDPGGEVQRKIRVFNRREEQEGYAPTTLDRLAAFLRMNGADLLDELSYGLQAPEELGNEEESVRGIITNIRDNMHSDDARSQRFEALHALRRAASRLRGEYISFPQFLLEFEQGKGSGTRTRLFIKVLEWLDTDEREFDEVLRPTLKQLAKESLRENRRITGTTRARSPARRTASASRAPQQLQAPAGNLSTEIFGADRDATVARNTFANWALDFAAHRFREPVNMDDLVQYFKEDPDFKRRLVKTFRAFVQNERGLHANVDADVRRFRGNLLHFVDGVVAFWQVNGIRVEIFDHERVAKNMSAALPDSLRTLAGAAGPVVSVDASESPDLPARNLDDIAPVVLRTLIAYPDGTRGGDPYMQLHNLVALCHLHQYDAFPSGGEEYQQYFEGPFLQTMYAAGGPLLHTEMQAAHARARADFAAYNWFLTARREDLPWLNMPNPADYVLPVKEIFSGQNDLFWSNWQAEYALKQPAMADAFRVNALVEPESNPLSVLTQPSAQQSILAPALRFPAAPKANEASVAGRRPPLFRPR